MRDYVIELEIVEGNGGQNCLARMMTKPGIQETSEIFKISEVWPRGGLRIKY